MKHAPLVPAALAHPSGTGPPGDRPLPGASLLISESWQRSMRDGVDPERGRRPGLLSAGEIEERRRSSPLHTVLPELREGLRPVSDTDWHVMVVSDAEGRVLWRDGSRAGRQRADSIGFVEGACWAEPAVGTNAVGTALVARRPLQVASAEHFLRPHQGWTCVSSPLRDPRDGRLLGVVDVSGPAATAHPATLALVTAVGRVAEGELRARHWESIERLRSVAAPVLARVGGKAVAVDRDGWTAGVTGMAPTDRVALPEAVRPGEMWLPSLGHCTLEPLPGGWLLRVRAARTPEAAGRVVLDLTQRHCWTITVSGDSGPWEQRLTPRHAELLFVLARHREGRTAAGLAADLFGDPGRAVTVRAELTRLRRHLSGVLAHRPYRFCDEVEVELRCPPDRLDLLPFSTAPAVVAARHEPD